MSNTVKRIKDGVTNALGYAKQKTGSLLSKVNPKNMYKNFKGLSRRNKILVGLAATAVTAGGVVAFRYRYVAAKRREKYCKDHLAATAGKAEITKDDIKVGLNGGKIVKQFSKDDSNLPSFASIPSSASMKYSAPQAVVEQEDEVIAPKEKEVSCLSRIRSSFSIFSFFANKYKHAKDDAAHKAPKAVHQ